VLEARKSGLLVQGLLNCESEKINVFFQISNRVFNLLRSFDKKGFDEI
jgi:hypothetical protein